MTNKKIGEINDAVKALSSSMRNGEELFKLGVELGKFLATSGADFDRLPYFVERELENSKQERLREKRQAISDVIQRLIVVACAEQIKISGSITFDSVMYWRGGKLIDDEVADEFFVQCHSVRQEDEEQDFEVEFEIIGELADLFHKYEARTTICVNAHNLDYDTKLVVTNVDDLKGTFGRAWINFENNSAQNDEAKLDEFFDEINKVTMFLQIKFSEVWS